YSSFACSSSSTTSANGKLPEEVHLWEDFLEKSDGHIFDKGQFIFQKPEFYYNRVLFNESNVCEAVNANINTVLNDLMEGYDFSTRKPRVGQPDFTCYHNDDLITLVEVKRMHVFEKMGEQTLSEFYKTSEKAKMVVRQTYGYMTESPEVLYISKTLSLQSKAPPVLKAYAYLALQAKN
ncbi:26285_t:CDS:2, partial [Racocetra persica]